MRKKKGGINAKIVIEISEMRAKTSKSLHKSYTPKGK